MVYFGLVRLSVQRHIRASLMRLRGGLFKHWLSEVKQLARSHTLEIESDFEPGKSVPRPQTVNTFISSFSHEAQL